MLSYLAFVALAPAMPVACTARFYSTSPKVHTYHQVFLLSLDGKRRKQLTTSPRDKGHVRWVGNETVAYTENSTSGENLYLQSITSGKRKVLARAEYFIPETAGTYDRGVPWFERGSTGKAYVIRGGAFVAAKGAPPYAAKSPLMGKNWILRVTQGVPGEENPPRLEANGRSVSWPDLSRPNNLVIGSAKSNGTPYILVLGGESTHGHATIVYRVDTSAMDVEIVAMGADLDFVPGLPTYAATTRRDFGRIGEKNVWTNEVIVTKVGQPEMPILNGLVYTTSVSLHPSIR